MSQWFPAQSVINNPPWQISCFNLITADRAPGGNCVTLRCCHILGNLASFLGLKLHPPNSASFLLHTFSVVCYCLTGKHHTPITLKPNTRIESEAMMNEHWKFKASYLLIRHPTYSKVCSNNNREGIRCILNLMTLALTTLSPLSASLSMSLSFQYLPTNSRSSSDLFMGTRTEL